MNRSIYRFNVNVPRMGTLTGLFVALDIKVSELIGQEIDFGEALGKHSEVSIILERKHFEKVTEDVLAIEIFEAYEFQSGYNPFDYYNQEENEE